MTVDKIKIRSEKPNPKTEDGALVLMEEAWSDKSVPKCIVELCGTIFKKRNRRNDFRYDSIQQSRTFAKRIATLLCGLLELKLVSEEEIYNLRDEDDTVPFLQKKLGFYTFKLMLDKDENKRKYLQQSAQDFVWNRLNGFSADPKHKSKIQNPAEYVEKYKGLLTAVKARMYLAEIIDVNVKDRIERSKFFTKNSKFNYEHLNYRAVFSYIILTAYTAETAAAHDTIEDLSVLRNSCLDKKVVFGLVERFISNVIPNERIKEALINLNELTEYYWRLVDIAEKGTLRKFILFLGIKAEYTKRIWKYSDMVAKWKVFYGNRSPFAEHNQTGFSSPKLSKYLRSMNRHDLVELVHRYPHLILFFGMYDMMYYLCVESDDEAKKKILSLTDKEFLSKCELALEEKYSVREFIVNYCDQPSDDMFSFTKLLETIDRLDGGDKDTERFERRARVLMVYALSELPFNSAIDLIKKYKEVGIDINTVFPESYRAYIWYYYRDIAKKPVDLSYPDESMRYIEAGDVDRFSEKRIHIIKTREEVAKEVGVASDEVVEDLIGDEKQEAQEDFGDIDAEDLME